MRSFLKASVTSSVVSSVRAGALAAGVLVASAAAAWAGDLSVTISGAQPHQGKVMVGLFASADEFANQKILSGQELALSSSDTVQATFHNVPAGRYLVGIYQDHNGDHVLNLGDKGQPTELYGFASTAGGKPPFGPPQFESLAVTVGSAPLALKATLGNGQ